MDPRDFGFEAKRPEVFDSSMLKDFINCESYFYLRHILGLRRTFPSGEGEAKFDWGTCWHHVMEAYTGSNYDMTAGLVALDTNYPAYIIPEKDKHKRSKDRMIEAFFGYVDKWKGDQADYEILRQEQFFDVFDSVADLRWCGRMDDMRRRRRTGRTLIWDYKTSSSMGPSYFDQHELGFQFPGYIFAGDLMVAGEEVMEITIDVMYMITASHDYFRRTFRYPRPRLDEWIHNVKMILDRINRKLDESMYDMSAWIKNWNYCTNWGRCDFFNVHSLTPSGDSRLVVLRNDYTVDRWDPRV